MTMTICNECGYPCFKTSELKVSLVLYSDISRGGDRAASPAPQIRAMCNTILTSEFPAAGIARHNHSLCIFVIDLLVLKTSCFNGYIIGGEVHYFSLEIRMSSFYRLLKRKKREKTLRPGVKAFY